MTLTKDMTQEEIMLKMLDEVYNGPAKISSKIAWMINTRRNNHGNDLVQNKCNEYLTKLYDEKFERLCKGENYAQL